MNCSQVAKIVIKIRDTAESLDGRLRLVGVLALTRLVFRLTGAGLT